MTRLEYLDEMQKRGSTAGSAFCMDDEIERFFLVWVDNGRPENVWVGYGLGVQDGKRVVQLIARTEVPCRD